MVQGSGFRNQGVGSKPRRVLFGARGKSLRAYGKVGQGQGGELGAAASTSRSGVSTPLFVITRNAVVSEPRSPNASSSRLRGLVNYYGRADLYITQLKAQGPT